jgi:hypothetical protein
MKKLIVILLWFGILGTPGFAQKSERFDLISFKPPTGWQKEFQANAVQLGAEDANGGVCLITIFKSIPASADSKANFDAAWKTIVDGIVTAGKPKMNPSGAENGWKVESGVAEYQVDGKKGIVLLLTASGSEKMVNILIFTTTNSFEANIADFLASLNLTPIEAKSEPKSSISPVSSTNDQASSIVGTWGRGNSVTRSGGSFGRWSYTKQQYNFTANGRYSYLRKNYVEDDKETFLTIESGNYIVNGQTITLNPKSNVIEAWSKKNGGDNYNQLISRQKLPLETTIYQFTFHIFPELKETDFVLISDHETVRDGRFNAGDKFPNGWRFSSSAYQPIKLPE